VSRKNTEEAPGKGFVYYFFRKRYPAWIYTLFILLYAVTVFFWIRYRYLKGM